MEKATGEAGKVDEKKTEKAGQRYTHKSNNKSAGDAGKLSEGGESSQPKTASTENKGDGMSGSPLKEMHSRHAAAHDAMDAKHKGEREALHAEHEKNLAKHGARPDVHATHHSQRTRMHRHHADERRALNDQHTMDHLQAASIHGGAGLGATPEAGAGPGATPSPAMASAGVGAAGAGSPPAATGQPQPPMGGAPAAAMA